MWAAYKAAKLAKKEELAKECEAQVQKLFRNVIAKQEARLKEIETRVIEEYESNVRIRMAEIQHSIEQAIAEKKGTQASGDNSKSTRIEIRRLVDEFSQMFGAFPPQAQLTR